MADAGSGVYARLSSESETSYPREFGTHGILSLDMLPLMPPSRLSKYRTSSPNDLPIINSESLTAILALRPADRTTAILSKFANAPPTQSRTD